MVEAYDKSKAGMHRHRFEAKHHKRLDSAYRRRILPPSTTLKRFGLKRGMVVADIGSGSGYFLIPAARIVGKEAAAYAVDASKDMLAVVKSKKPPTNVVPVSHKGWLFLRNRNKFRRFCDRKRDPP